MEFADLFFILICVILALQLGKIVYVDVSNEPKVLARTGGLVQKDNFSYFYVQSHGSFILNLTSLVGDADVYISDTNMYPTYNPESYILHSATCGEDIIEVPEGFERPLAIGVYGHADSSFYMLDIYENPSSPSLYIHHVLIERMIENFQDTGKRETKHEGINIDNDIKVQKKRKNRSTSNIPTIFSVFEVLQMIFL